MKKSKFHNKLKAFFKTNVGLKLVLMLAVVGLAVGITASIQSALAFENYELTEGNVLEVEVQQKKASSTATIKYKTGAWYLFPEKINGDSRIYNSLSEWTSQGGKQLPFTSYNLKERTPEDSYGVFYDYYAIPEETIVPIVLDWYTDENGVKDREALVGGVEVFASRTLQVVKNGSVTGTYYCYDTIADAAGWSGGALTAFLTSYDKPLFLTFNGLDFSIEVVNEKGSPISEDLYVNPYTDDGIRLYGETLEKFSYPGTITNYSYQGYELVKEYASGDTEVVQSGGATATSTSTYKIKLEEKKGEYDLVLRFKYATKDIFIPTKPPTPTISVSPSPTTPPPVTVAPTVAPTPGPDEIVTGNYYHYFTTDLGHSMYSVINNTDYVVATHSGSGYDGTLLSATAITRAKSYYTGTDESGNTWYFRADGTNAVNVHPAVYNGNNVNTDAIKNITELVFPSTLTKGSTTYTVTSIGGGTDKYHTIDDNGDSSSETTSYDYDPYYGYYSYFKESETASYLTVTSTDQEYAFGVLGNGYIETNGLNEKTKVSTGEYECTDITRNYYVYNTTLRSITIPDSVKYIEDYAFLYCQNLSEIEGGNGLLRIGTMAFGAEDSIPVNHCMTYTNISEDANSTQIEYHEYNLDTKWVTYVTEDGVSHTACNDGDDHRYCTFVYEPDTELILHTKKVVPLTKTRLELPVFPVLTTIRRQAFDHRANLWEVELNSTVNSIGWGAFNGCYLDSIEIPSTSLSIDSSGSVNQAKRPDYETLGTNKAGEDRTIIYSSPGTTAVKYGRTYPDYYRLKAGYTITYHSNNGENKTVQQISDMEYLMSDYSYVFEDYTVEADGTVSKVTANSNNTVTITQIGTMPGGVEKLLYKGTHEGYVQYYDNSSNTEIYGIPFSVEATYLRGADGSVWRYVYEYIWSDVEGVSCEHDLYYGLERLDIPAGTEVYIFNGMPYYLSSDGYVMTVPLHKYDYSNKRYSSVTTGEKFGYTDYSDTTTYDYRFNSFSSVKADVLEQRGGRIVMQRSSDSTWHFLDRVDYLDRDNDGTIIYDSSVDTDGNTRQEITFSKISGVSGEPIAVNIDDSNATTYSYIITNTGRAYRLSSSYDNVYTFRSATYSGSIGLATLKGGTDGLLYDADNQIISAKVQSGTLTLTATGIYGPVKEACPYSSGTKYYYLMESGALCHYDSSTNNYTSVLPGTKFVKVQAETIGTYALTDSGDVYDVTAPSSPSVYIGGYGAKDFLFYPGSTYYQKMYVVTADGTLVGKGYKLYKNSSNNYVDSPSAVIRIPDITGAQKISSLPNNRLAVYTEEGIYVETNGVWNFHIIDKGCNFTAEVWGNPFKIPAGYAFVSWNTASNGSGTDYNPGDTITMSANVNLYAQYLPSETNNPRIRYHANGGNGSMADTVLAKGVSSATLSKNTFTPPEGYIQKTPCWNTKPDGSGTSYADGAAVTGITDHIDLYAQWTSTAGTGQYTLVYMTYPYGTAGNTVWKQKVMTLGQAETIEGAPYTPSASTYTVTYNLNKPSGMSTTPLAYTLAAENTTAYAATTFERWRLYKVLSGGQTATGTYFEPGEQKTDLAKTGGEVLYLYPCWEGSSRAEVYLPYTEADGYVFKGWSETADGTRVIYEVAAPEDEESVGTFTPVKNTTLYGIWVPKQYIVTLNGNGATTQTQTSVIMTFDEICPAVTPPARTQYLFQGYYTALDANGEPAAGSVQYYGANGDSVQYWRIHDGSVTTLYAYWKKASYTLTLNDRGATSTDHTERVIMTYDQKGADIVVPTKTGYTFHGYYTETRGNGTQYYDENGTCVKTWTEDDKDTLYAYWTQNPVILPEEDETVVPAPVPEKDVEGSVSRNDGKALLYADDYNAATKALTDLQPYLTYDTPGMEGVIPGTELLSFRAKVGSWMLSYKFHRFSGTDYVRVYVTVPYRTQYELDNEELVISLQQTKTYSYSIPKVWSYWEIMESGMFYPCSVMIENAALKNGYISVPVDWNNEDAVSTPSYSVTNYGDKENHVFWEEYDADGAPVLRITLTEEQYIISETVGSLPDINPHLDIVCKNAAWKDERQAEVRSDLYEFDGVTVLSDELAATGEGKELEEENLLKNNSVVGMTVYQQTYKSGIELDEYKPNGTYTTTITVYYDGDPANVGASGTRTETLRDVNPLKIHTPVACDGIIVDGMEETEDSTVLVLDEVLNFFTLRIDNTGTHRMSLGYGTKDFALALSGKSNIAKDGDSYLNQVQFPFDVYVDMESNSLQADGSYDTMGDLYVEAGTWLTMGKQELRFYVPVMAENGMQQIRFRTIAVNCPKNIAGEYKINSVEQEHANISPDCYVATDSIRVIINSYLKDFRITDTSDPLAKKQLLSGCQALTLKKGYGFQFEFLTQGEFYGEDTELEIIPRFYWVSKTEESRTEVQLYQEDILRGEEKEYYEMEMPPLQKEEKADVIFQCWTGSGFIPADVVCLAADDTEGYLIVNFEIRVKSNDDVWYTFEDWENTELAQDAAEEGWNYVAGDVIRYDLSKSIADDYEIGGME